MVQPKQNHTKGALARLNQGNLSNAQKMAVISKANAMLKK